MDRTRGIGGSDIAAIMGISPWNTAYGVYLDKIGEGKPIQGKHLELGHKAQGPILRKYEKESGYIVEAEDVEIVHFGNAIADNLRQLSIVIDEYKPTPSYDHSEVKEARYA